MLAKLRVGGKETEVNERSPLLVFFLQVPNPIPSPS